MPLDAASLTGSKGAATCVRGHWAVEANLHWQLHVSFNEGQQRMRKGFAAENHSRLNSMVLDILKQELTVKLSIKKKTAISRLA